MSCIEGPSIEGLWGFVCEREAIRFRKEEKGSRPPFSTCPILKTFFFCNVRREHDKGTLYYLERVAPAALELSDLLWRTILYRAINNSVWFQHTFGGVFGRGQWALGTVERRQLEDALRSAEPPYSPAYIVLQGPDGATRKQHLLQLLSYLEENIESITSSILLASSLKNVWRLLQEIPYIGPFIALQIYRDLLLVGKLPFKDNDFTYLGPGARKGLFELTGLRTYKEQYKYLRERILPNQPECLQPPLTLGDCEHIMCEAGKYWRLSRGGGRHRYYRH